MSAIKWYRFVIFGVYSIALILGTFWNTVETMRQWYAAKILDDKVEVMGDKTGYQLFVYSIGAILAIPIVFKVERIVDFFGHSHIFILASVTFIVRFSLMYSMTDVSYLYLLELLEAFSWYLPWITFIIFSRHLISKRYFALGQAILVILYHSFSKGLGTWLGAAIEPTESAKISYLTDNFFYLAIVASVVATFILILYHCILMPWIRVPVDHLAPNSDNTSLSPQRVFHDERARKGYFRY